jgi:hypothetical protein
MTFDPFLTYGYGLPSNVSSPCKDSAPASTYNTSSLYGNGRYPIRPAPFFPFGTMLAIPDPSMN